MKAILILILVSFSTTCLGQKKQDITDFNKLYENNLGLYSKIKDSNNANKKVVLNSIKSSIGLLDSFMAFDILEYIKLNNLYRNNIKGNDLDSILNVNKLNNELFLGLKNLLDGTIFFADTAVYVKKRYIAFKDTITSYKNGSLIYKELQIVIDNKTEFMMDCVVEVVNLNSKKSSYYTSLIGSLRRTNINDYIEIPFGKNLEVKIYLRYANVTDKEYLYYSTKLLNFKSNKLLLLTINDSASKPNCLLSNKTIESLFKKNGLN